MELWQEVREDRDARESDMVVTARNRSFQDISLGSLLACESFPDFPLLCLPEKLGRLACFNGMSVPPSVHAVTQTHLCGAFIHTLCLMFLLWWHLCGRRCGAPGVLWGSGDASLIYPSSCRSHKAELWAAA